jgi:hypothetical protein
MCLSLFERREHIGSYGTGERSAEFTSTTDEVGGAGIA